MSSLSRAIQWLGSHGFAAHLGFVPLIAGERKDSVVAGGAFKTFTWGDTNPPTHSENNGSVYWYRSATLTEDVFWLRKSGAWVKLGTMSSLMLSAATVCTISGADTATITQAVHTLTGASDPDNLDIMTGADNAEFGFFVAGAPVVNIRDAATVGAGGNIATPGNATLTTAVGDLLFWMRSGSVYSIFPLAIAAGLPVSMQAVARRCVIRGSAGGRGEVVDLGADQGVLYSDGTDAKRGIIGAHSATPCTGAAVAQHDATACTGAAVAQHDATACTGAAVAQHDATACTGAAVAQHDATACTGAAVSDHPSVEIVIPVPVFGPWAKDGDGLLTNGGGMVGAVPVGTQVGTGRTLVYDAGTGEYEVLETPGATWRTVAYQLAPDAPANGDAVLIGYDIPFVEAGLPMVSGGTPATWTGNAGKWQYSQGGGVWADQPALNDNSDATAQDGMQPFQRDGALTHDATAIPLWAPDTLGGFGPYYWLRWLVTDATKFNVLGVATKRHQSVASEEPFVPTDTQTGSLTHVRISDGAAILHTAGWPVQFLIHDAFTGASRSVSFAPDRRVEKVALATPLTLTTSSRLSFHVVVEDGTNEPANVLLELFVTRSPLGHSVTQPNTPALTHSVTQPNTPALTHSVTQPSTPSLGHTIA